MQLKRAAGPLICGFVRRNGGELARRRPDQPYLGESIRAELALVSDVRRLCRGDQ
jgi:hypothetical protein